MTKPERGLGSFQNLILAIQIIQLYLYLKNSQSILKIVSKCFLYDLAVFCKEIDGYFYKKTISRIKS